MERWHDVALDDLRWNDLCTKEATGQCALCDKLAERERFEQHRVGRSFVVEGEGAGRGGRVPDVGEPAFERAPRE